MKGKNEESKDWGNEWLEEKRDKRYKKKTCWMRKRWAHEKKRNILDTLKIERKMQGTKKEDQVKEKW